eukprot:m.12812 g.12812  ORF g.12812 m.12812 type:complete len:609 (+) comp10038_c0_seq1:397-2223(+)
MAKQTIAMHELPPDVAGALAELDTDGDGVVSVSELLSHLHAKHKRDADVRQLKKIGVIMTFMAFVIIAALAGSVFGIVEAERRTDTDGDALLSKATGNMVKVKEQTVDVPLGALFYVSDEVLQQADLMTVKDTVMEVTYVRRVQATTINLNDEEIVFDFTDGSSMRVFKTLGVAVFTPTDPNLSSVGVCSDCGQCGFKSTASKDVVAAVDKYLADITTGCGERFLEARPILEQARELYLPEEFYTLWATFVNSSITTGARRALQGNTNIQNPCAAHVCVRFCQNGYEFPGWGRQEIEDGCQCWQEPDVGQSSIYAYAWEHSPFSQRQPVVVTPPSPPPASFDDACKATQEPTYVKFGSSRAICAMGGWKLAAYVPASAPYLDWRNPFWTTPYGSQRLTMTFGVGHNGIGVDRRSFQIQVPEPNISSSEWANIELPMRFLRFNMPATQMKISFGGYDAAVQFDITKYNNPAARGSGWPQSVRNVFSSPNPRIYIPYASPSWVRSKFLNDKWFTAQELATFNSQPHCNKVATGGVNHGKPTRYGWNGNVCRFGMFMNNENDCTSSDAAVGIGCTIAFKGERLNGGGLSPNPWSSVNVMKKDLWIWVYGDE